MDKEEIEEKAKQLYFEQALMPIQLGVAIAEWMQEQIQQELNDTIIKLTSQVRALENKVAELTDTPKISIRPKSIIVNAEELNEKQREELASHIIRYMGKYSIKSKMNREQYKEEALRIMQDVEEEADLLEDRDEAEKLKAEIAELTNLVSARDGMIEQMAERMEELDNKVSELTEELDASHIFCEGVKGAVVNKTCDTVCEFCHEPCPTFDKCDIIKNIRKAMKGDKQ